MKTLERVALYPSPPEKVFQCLDDLSVTGMHMTQSSMMMMGSNLDLKFLSPNQTGLGTTYRWNGKMMGMQMDFTVKVTKWLPGEEKTWETIGESKMIIYSWYRMNLLLKTIPTGTSAKLSISYEKPEGLWNRLLSFFFANWYCRWCLRHMMEDCRKTLLKSSA